MKCTSWGSEMKDYLVINIIMERCTKCKGQVFDAYEFETLIASRANGQFFKLLKKLFKVNEDNSYLF